MIRKDVFESIKRAEQEDLLDVALDVHGISIEQYKLALEEMER